MTSQIEILDKYNAMIAAHRQYTNWMADMYNAIEIASKRQFSIRVRAFMEVFGGPKDFVRRADYFKWDVSGNSIFIEVWERGRGGDMDEMLLAFELDLRFLLGESAALAAETELLEQFRSVYKAEQQEDQRLAAALKNQEIIALRQRLAALEGVQQADCGV